jgi:hypothetical protein
VGILVSLDKAAGAGDASLSVSIVDNNIADINGFDAAIFLRSNGGTATSDSVLEATISGNTISELGDNLFAGIYAQVGGNGPGDFAQLGLDLTDNVLDMSDADFAYVPIFLDQVSNDAHFNFPGYTGSADGEANGGTASEDLAQFFADQGNVITDVPFPSWGFTVDAQLVLGATGDPFSFPVP